MEERMSVQICNITGIGIKLGFDELASFPRFKDLAPDDVRDLLYDLNVEYGYYEFMSDWESSSTHSIRHKLVTVFDGMNGEYCHVIFPISAKHIENTLGGRAWELTYNVCVDDLWKYSKYRIERFLGEQIPGIQIYDITHKT